jgi:hypothetical protein
MKRLTLLGYLALILSGTLLLTGFQHDEVVTAARRRAAGAPIARVHVNAPRHCAAASSCAATITATGAGGNALFAAVVQREDSNKPITSVTATGATFTCDLNNANLGTHYTIAFCSAPNVASGITTVTANYADASGDSSVIVGEYSGILTSSILDTAKTTINSGAGTTWISTGSGTLSQANELALGIEFNDANNGVTLTGSGGWTVVATSNMTSEGATMGYCEQIVSATTSLSNTGTAGTSGGNYTNIATYKGH